MSTSRILRNAVMLAVFAVVCIVGMEYLALNIGQPNPVSHGYRVQAVFADADGIPTSADVRVAGVVVGKVTGINHDPEHPGSSVTTLEITDSRAEPVYTNGFAKVRPKTLLGEKYVDLTVGNQQGEAIPDMGMLPEARTSKVVENDEIFNAFDGQTRAQQQQVLQALDKATQQRGGDIQAILPQLQQVITDLQPLARVYEKDNVQVDHIFVQLNTLMKALADEHEQLAGFLGNGNIALSAIAQRNASLIKTLQGFANVTAELNTAMAPTVEAQRQSLSRLAPTLDTERAFLDQVIGPQAACGNRPCGLDKLINGTLLGQINYPNDQLNFSSPDGSLVTQAWDSMFSYPTTFARSGSTHSAQNIVLSFHCDEISGSLGGLGIPINPGGVQNVVQDLINKACVH